MTAPTRNVTVRLFDAHGNACPDGTTVSARLDQQDVYQGFVVPTVFEAETTGGIAVVPCFPNHPTTGLGTTGSKYTFYAGPAGWQPWRVEDVQVPDNDCDLDAIATLTPAPTLSEAQAAMAAAAASAGAAATSAAAAATSASDAASAASAAAGSASAAATSETNASTSAAAAAVSASSADTSASSAAGSASAAASSATAASNSAAAAAASAAAAEEVSLGNFVQDGAGAVARSFSDKVREIVSVKDFGTSAAACALALATGAAVYVPRGSYDWDSTITLPTQPRIYGAGIEKTIVNSDIPGDSLIKFASSGVSFGHIADMTFRGNGLRGASGSGHCINGISPNPGAGSLTPQNCTFERLRIEDFLGTDDSDETGVGKVAAAGIIQYSTVANTIRKVYISDCGNGIYMRATQNCLIDDAVVIECDKAGIFAHLNDRLVIANSDILKCGESVKYSAVTISNASPGVVTWAAHGLSNGDLIDLRTTGSLPTGLSVNATYQVVNAAADTFELSATSGGASINTSSAGAGTHYAMSGADKGYPVPDAQLVGNIVVYGDNGLHLKDTKSKGFKGKANIVLKGDAYGVTIGPNNWLRGDAQIDMPHKTIYASRVSGLGIKDNLFTPSNTGFSATQAYEEIEIHSDSNAMVSSSEVSGNTFTEASGFNKAYNVRFTGNAAARIHKTSVFNNHFGTPSSRSSALAVTADVLVDTCTITEGSRIGGNTHYAPTNVTRTSCYTRSGGAILQGGTILQPSTFNTITGSITARYTGMYPEGAVAFRTNANYSLQVGVDAQNQILNAAITADRIITLLTTGAVDGDEFILTRTAAATGAFNWNVVHAAGTKALTAGTWCRVRFDGTSWHLVAAGAL